MFKYLVKNLKSLLTKQGVISLLLVVNIVVSALVICFSYGLYQNYNIIINESESEHIDCFKIRIKDEYISTDQYSPYTTEVTVGMVKDFIYMLDGKDFEVIDFIYCKAGYYTDLYYPSHKPEKDGYFLQDYYFTIEDGELSIARLSVPYYKSVHDYITNQSIKNGQKVAVVSKEFFEEEAFSYMWGFPNGGGKYYILDKRTQQGDRDYIRINGEDYKLVGLTRDRNMTAHIYVPFTSLPDDTKISSSYLEINIKKNKTITEKVYNDILDCAEIAMGEYTYVEEVEITETTEAYYYKTIILISVVIAILAAINMAILYRYIFEKRSSELAILRICGCSKRKAVRMYLLECMLVNAPLFALTEYVYHKLIMPKLTGIFPHMEGAYSKNLYLVILGIYVVASLVVMLVMIAVTVGKHSLVEQKNISKAKSRFGIMKVFEIIQLSVVIGIAVFLVSAIVSRYTYYLPFKDVLNSQGYISFGSTRYVEEIEELAVGCDVIYFSESSIQKGKETIRVLQYDDTFVNAITPSVKEGVWLTETDISYKKNRVIPIVVTDKSGYKLGDKIDFEVDEYDPIDYNKKVATHEYSYQVVGIIEDGVRVAGKLGATGLLPKDFNDFYSVNDYEYLEQSFAFMKNSDMIYYLEDDWNNSYSKKGRARYIQFIITNNLSSEQKAQVEQNLKDNGMTLIPLSEINENSLEYIYEQMYTLFPIALCIFILTVISAVSINAIYTKRQLRNYAIFYICGARWRTCALKSLKDSAITCAVASALCALILFIGKQSFLKETVISFGIWHAVVCLGVIALYLILSMIMPIAIIGSSEPKDVLKEE